jgi:hypothetical protein
VRMKVQDHSSTLETKRAQQVSIQLASKFTTSTLMAADRLRIGIKTSDIRDKKVRTKCMTQEKIINKIEEAQLGQRRGPISRKAFVLHVS